MKTRSNEKTSVKLSAKIVELRQQVRRARASYESARSRAHKAKAKFKRIRKAFKLAKKEAKEMRKKLKVLMHARNKAAIAATKPPTTKTKKNTGTKSKSGQAKVPHVVRPKPAASLAESPAGDSVDRSTSQTPERTPAPTSPIIE